MTEPTRLLAAEGISKRFGGVHALHDVSFDICAGEVHALVGENGSGKSTLIKIIAGVLAPDHGTISVGDETFERLTPRSAISHGIEVIFQDFSLFPNLTVAENISMSTYIAGRRKLVRPRGFRVIAEEVVGRIGIDVDLDARVSDLSVADRQLTAICRALEQDARIIFMDEPTTALTRREVQALFRLVQVLKEHGVALVFVSHKLDEVMQIAERITVLRNGVLVAHGAIGDFDRTSLVRAMTGKPLTDTPPSDSVRADAAPVLAVKGLTLAGAFADISFEVRPGEVVGVTGLLGSGRTEIAESLFGIRRADSGTIEVDGKAVRIKSVRDAVRAGIGYVPADRLTQGIFLDQPISVNLIAGSLDRLVGKLDMLRGRRAARLVDDAAGQFRILMSSSAAPARSLSGGNQQRVVLAKWLTRSPRILMLNGPTVGVDIGSKHEILDMLRAKAGEGVAILVISDDVPELVAVCHRVLVVRQGRIADVLEGARIQEDTIVKELVA